MGTSAQLQPVIGGALRSCVVSTPSAPPAQREPTVVRWFRVIAVTEACTYLALIASSVVRRVSDTVDPVPVVGLVHGLIFLIYVAVALAARRELRWPLTETLFVLVAAVIPLGGIVVERRLHRSDAVLSRSTARRP